MNDFSIKDFVETLQVDEDDHYLKTAKQVVEIMTLLNDDPWSLRADLYGLTASADNLLTYNGNNRLRNLERRLNVLEGTGYLSESDISVNWHSNEDQAHANTEIPKEEQIMDLKNMIDNCVQQMKVAAIKFVVFMPEHDKVSRDLEQMTYSEIKQASARKRSASMSQRSNQAA